MTKLNPRIYTYKITLYQRNRGIDKSNRIRIK